MADLFRLDPLNQEEEKKEKELFTIAPMGQEDSTYKNILEENKDIPFIDRVLNPQKYPSPTLTDDQGRKQTHFMSADKDENDNWIHTDTDVSSESAEVQGIAAAVWTDTIKEAKRTANENV